MTAYGLVQCDEVVQVSLRREELTLPRTSLASLRSGNTLEQKARQDLLYIHAEQFEFKPGADQSNPLPLL